MIPPRVVLDIFSGRGNPEWLLQPPESAELARRLAGLARSAAVPPSEGLGYRGVLVEQGSAPGDLLRVHDGLVTFERDPAQMPLLDPGRSLERWLLESGRGRVDPGLLSAALSGFDGGP
jgi:hypothetical protein